MQKAIDGAKCKMCHWLFYDKVTFNSILQGKFGEGNGTPLQYPCLENPMDGGAW